MLERLNSCLSPGASSAQKVIQFNAGETMSGQFNMGETPARSLAAGDGMQTDSSGVKRTLDTIVSNAANKQAFLAWDAIDAEIGRAEDPGLQRQLMERRTQFVEEVFTRVTGEIEEA